MKRKQRRQTGASITEFAVVISFGLPLLLLIGYVALELAHFYTIKSAMELGARNAARALVIIYNRTGQKRTAVDFLTMQNYIAGSGQFTVQWDTATVPNYVTVTCKYPAGGGNGLPAFPGGPLRMFSQSNANFYLNTFTVAGTFTLPIQ